MFSKCSRSEKVHNLGHAGLILISVLLLALVILSQIYKEEIVGVGNDLLIKYQENNLYCMLFFIAAVSSTLVPLPIWIYVYTSVLLGFNYVECAIVLGLGAGVGSFGSYVFGRYFGNTKFFERRFKRESLERWRGRSQTLCGLSLFFGSISPVPMDALYAVSGIIRFPMLVFICLVSTGRVLRYMLMGYIIFVIQ